MRRLWCLFIAVLMGAWAGTAAGQTPDTTAQDTFRVQLPEVTVKAARSAVTSESAPFAVTIESRSPEEVALTKGTSLDDLLRSVPGVWVNNRHHFALGERISVRGVGYRSNFGVRGIQVLYDGIPLTLPDGQAFLDVVDPAVVRSVELIRSPAALFWGNGSGGVLFLSSAPSASAPTLRARAQGGRYGQWQGLLEGAVRQGSWQFHGYSSVNRQDGYRRHSQGYRLRGGVSASGPIGPNTQLRITAAGNAQDTENPSSLTREQFRTNPRQARPLFLEYNAGKTSEQGQLGVSLDRALGPAVLSASAHYVHRSLENPLPFGFVTYDRNSGGGRLTLHRQSGRLQGGVGIDGGVQRDDRVEYTATRRGVRGDSTTLAQVETVTSGSAFGYLQFAISNRFRVTGGLRVDGLRFEADDQLIADGIDSGSRTFSAISPAVGVSYDVGPALFFAQYSTAFETPTAGELSNRPDQSGGFNQQLDPQRTRGVEVGTRGVLAANRLEFDIALYRQRVDDLISAQRLQTGYQYYTNLGKNVHQGVEASVTWSIRPSVELAARYTGTHYRIQEPTELEGNDVPGIPPHRGYLHVQAERRGVWGRISAEGVPDFYVDNDNTATSPEYVLVDLRVGHRGMTWQDLTFQPFASVDNLLDQRYAASVLVNGGGAYYEPGPARSFSLGLNVAW